MGELKRAISSSTSLSVAASIASNTALSVATPCLANPVEPDYVNPLESSARWYLTARASAVRYAASLGFGLANRSEPAAPSPSRDVWLDSTLSQWKGRQKIKVEVWVPPRIAVGSRSAVINLHGGGWILGQGTDDARWAGALMSALDAVVFTVNYRLAPGYPFPVPLEDCIDALMQIVARGAEFGIDPSRVFLSGFSAGATIALGSWVILQDPSRWHYELTAALPEIAGIILFYPTLDITISRPEKRQACARPELTLSPGMTDLIDASYVYPPIPRDQRTDPRLSPGLMSDELVKKLPPMHLCLCEYDMLLAEGVRFAQRLQCHDKSFSIRIVDGEAHAWDKPPPMAPKESVNVEYGEATQAMARWLGRDCETDRESSSSKRARRMHMRRPRYLSFRSRSSR
ncbi:alpha/beta hydrolase fold domain-containing protein [Hirsutella rhossiliensis]|uniref:Alpha/beta hydrolase fold domain-containing protein n=1 Tax=Hirsutella rhossiliensis TaxID=111463 RepID=A0A9P8N080_9HYPO|nr:alpha/beta hydrolase fold domain-containing protein [Hirsutella rhossiliensis]KAH0964510.1 alpha/beta hydrolase fold domain-containing protein [Hirsutella rhossiliensis]